MNKEEEIMKILFVLNKTYNSTDANYNLALTIMEELKKYNNELIALGNTDCQGVSMSEKSNGIQYERFFFKKNDSFDLLMQSYHKKKYKRLRKIVGLLMNPKVCFEVAKDNLLPWNNIEKIYIKNIEKIVKKYNIDIIVSVSNPYFTAIAAAKSQVQCKRMLYQLDPHAFSLLINKKSKKLLKEEKYTCEKMDEIVITDLLYEENKNNELFRYLYKMKTINFPNVKKIQYKQFKNEIVFDKNFINCVFVGYFYEDIRNPKYILEIINKTENKNILFHIVGGGAEDTIRKYKDCLGSRLIIHGRVPLENAINVMLNADILINIGNTIPNQMPSKIFDYISSGKPIINICKSDNCPTLKYTKRYPLCLNIVESDEITNSVMNDFENFCSENKDKRIEFELIKDTFLDCTAEYVGEQFNNIINEVVVKINED